MIVFDYSTTPPTCLPEGLSTVSLVDITTIGDSWRVFLDPETGVIHDGNEYAKAIVPKGSSE